MPSLFVSDLHLAAARPSGAERFQRFLAGEARAARALYILGDLFEFWIGDETLADPFAAEIAAALRALTDSGTAVHLQHGNRDFLLGQGFARAAGVTLLPETALVDLQGEPTLLLHGDTLCTDDLEYQDFRRRVRDPAWIAAFLARPVPERLALARQLREVSAAVTGGKPAGIMDVRPQAVAAAFRRHGVRRMIHGHTHRPARHALILDHRPTERWVLPDWYGHGGALRVDEAGWGMVAID